MRGVHSFRVERVYLRINKKNKFTHTYALIEVVISMDSRERKIEKKRNNQMVSFRKLLCIYCSFLSSLSKSRHISLWLIRKLTIKCTVFVLFCFSLGLLVFIPQAGRHN